MTKLRAGEVLSFLKLLVTLWGRRPGWGYIAFAKLGLALVALGVSVLVPPIWEAIVEALIRAAIGDRSDLSPGLKLTVASVLVLFGFAIIGLAFRLYHRTVQTSGPSTEHDQAISTNVLPDSPVEKLIRGIAGTRKKVVDFTQLSPSERALIVAQGPLDARNFEDFLTKVGERTNPPLRLTWQVSGNFYRLSIQPPAA